MRLAQNGHLGSLNGLTEREILGEYPDLQTEDIRECLRFAAASAMEREMPLPCPA